MSSLAGIFPVSGGSFYDFPLLSSKIHYDLVDVQSLATLVLTYASNASTAVEVKYVCPLPSDASVCSFKAVMDGKRTVKGIVKDKAKAKAEYDAAVAQGRTAALLEQNNVEIFQVSLGNVQPKQAIDIYISLASLITGNGELDSLRLVFPCAITPHYGTSPNDLLPFGCLLSFGCLLPFRHLLPFGRPIKSALDFSVSIQMTSHIKSITSPSHPISLSLGSLKPDSDSDFDPFKAHVALTSQDHLDRDIVVAINCRGLDRPRCTVESCSAEEGGEEFTDAYSLTLVPRFELPPLGKQEYIFLVDRSGSMRSAMRAALQIMLRSLPFNNTTFNIFSFGSRYDSLWPSSVPYSTESLKTATTYVDGMQSDYGGTEIKSALHGVLETHTDAQDVPLTVFVLTDGQTYDLSGVQSTIAQHVDKYADKENFLRIFCMGIGNAVSKAMCDLIARAGRGAAVYVGENEKPDKKLVTLLSAARGPIITNISVDWGVDDGNAHMKDDGDDDFELVSSEPKADATPLSLFDEKAVPKDNVPLGPLTNIKLPPPPKVQQAPTNSSLPSLYPGFRTSIFAIIKRDNKRNTACLKAVRVKGIVQGRPVELEVPVTPATVLQASTDHDKVKLLHVLAARALVQRFEDEKKEDSIMSDTLKAEVLRVAVRYGITSSETSFVVVGEEAPAVRTATRNFSTRISRLFAGSNPSSIRVPFVSPSPPKPFGPPPARLFMVVIGPLTQVTGSTIHASRPPTQLPGPSPQLFGMFGSSPQVTGPSGPSTQVYGSFAQVFGSTPQQFLYPQGFTPQMNMSHFPSHDQVQAYLTGSRPLSARQEPTMAQGDVLSCKIAEGGARGFFPTSITSSRDEEERALRRNSEGGRSRSPEYNDGGVADYDSCKTVQSSSHEEDDGEDALKESSDFSIISIARYQTFEGYFEDSPGLCRLLVQKDTLPTMPDVLQQLNIANAETVWRSVFCIVFIRTKFPDDESVWVLIVEKGERWISETLAGVLGAEDVLVFVDTLKKEAKKCIV